MRSVLFVLVPLLSALGPTGDAAAQDFDNPEQEQLYQEYKNRLGVSDLDGIRRLAANNVTVALRVLDVLGIRYAFAPRPEALEEMRPLAQALDEKEQGKQYETRLGYLGGLDAEGHRARFAAHDKLRTANDAFDKAVQSKDSADYRRALLLLEEAIKALEEVKDLEWLSLARYRYGWCNDQVDQKLETVRAYDKSMDEWLAAGRPKNHGDYQNMVNRRRELVDQGYDPQKGYTGGGADAGPTKNTSTSFVEGSDWQEWTTEYKTMRSPDQFLTPSPFCSTHVLLWKQFGYFAGANALDHAGQNPCQPFGHALKVVRDGAKGLLDTDGDDKGDVPAKIIDGKASLVELTDGKDGQYGLFLLTGGQSQQWLGQSVNYQNLGFYRTASYREGTFLGQKVVLLDDNSSGTFGDARECRDNILRRNPEIWELDALVVGKGHPVPWSDVVGIEGRWYRLKPVDVHATKVQTRELNLETGSVEVHWDGPVAPVSLIIAEVKDLKGAFFEVAGGKPVTVPVGRYQVAVGKLETGKGNNVKQAWIFKGRSEPFEVKAEGPPTVLAMGAPYSLEFETQAAGSKFVVKGKSLLVYDKSGALVGHVFPDVILPEVEVQTESGTSLAKDKKTRLVDTDTFNKDNVTAWFMADFEVDRPSGANCQARLGLKKKHPLLGGPFESDWK